jgi:hypothetical protein
MSKLYNEFDVRDGALWLRNEVRLRGGSVASADLLRMAKAKSSPFFFDGVWFCWDLFKDARRLGLVFGSGFYWVPDEDEDKMFDEDGGDEDDEC